MANAGETANSRLGCGPIKGEPRTPPKDANRPSPEEAARAQGKEAMLSSSNGNGGRK